MPFCTTFPWKHVLRPLFNIHAILGLLPRFCFRTCEITRCSAKWPTFSLVNDPAFCLLAFFIGDSFTDLFSLEHGLILVAPGYLMYSKRYVVMPASLDMALFSFFLYAFYHCPILQILALRTAWVIMALAYAGLRFHFHLHFFRLIYIDTILIMFWFLHLVSFLSNVYMCVLYQDFVITL